MNDCYIDPPCLVKMPTILIRSNTSYTLGDHCTPQKLHVQVPNMSQLLPMRPLSGQRACRSADTSVGDELAQRRGPEPKVAQHVRATAHAHAANGVSSVDQHTT